MYDLNQSAEDRPTTIFSEPPQHLNPAAEFRDRLARFTPRVFVTPAILAINVLVFVAMIASGVQPLEPTTESLLRWGADFGPKTITSGEWWRLFTCMFLHIGVIHIAFNMFVLMQIGPFVERLLGNLGFLIVYVICGLAGSMVSLAWNPYVVSAGASGAIFGLYGILLGFICIRRDSVPSEVLSGLAKSALTFIGYNVIYGVMRSGTDLAAHAGGLAAGLVCGIAMSSPLTVEYVRRRAIRGAVVALAAIALLLVAAVRLPRPVDLLVEIRKFATVETKTLAAYRTVFNRARTQKLRDDQLADLVERELVAPWAAAHESLVKLTRQQLPFQQKQIVTRLVQYVEARQQGWSMLVQGLRKHDLQMVRQANEKQLEAERLAKSIGAGGSR
jgi:rhomboid protease GluP